MKDARELTREQSIEKTIEMWEELAETGSRGKSKTKAAQGYTYLICGCFLCTFVGENKQGYRQCKLCPYYQYVHGGCYAQNGPYAKWLDSWSTEKRKKYAKKIVEQLKEL